MTTRFFLKTYSIVLSVKTKTVLFLFKIANNRFPRIQYLKRSGPAVNNLNIRLVVILYRYWIRYWIQAFSLSNVDSWIVLWLFILIIVKQMNCHPSIFYAYINTMDKIQRYRVQWVVTFICRMINFPTKITRVTCFSFGLTQRSGTDPTCVPQDSVIPDLLLPYSAISNGTTLNDPGWNNLILQNNNCATVLDSNLV